MKSARLSHPQTLSLPDKLEKHRQIASVRGGVHRTLALPRAVVNRKPPLLNPLLNPRLVNRSLLLKRVRSVKRCWVLKLGSHLARLRSVACIILLLAELASLRKKHPGLADKVLIFIFNTNREEEEERRAKEEADRREREQREAEEKDKLAQQNKRKNPPSRSEYESLSKKVSVQTLARILPKARL